MKYILLVICVVCASSMMAVDYKLHQTSSFKNTSSSQVYSGSGGGTAIAYTTVASVPAVSFQSTSAMSGIGSALPQAAVSGTYTTYDSNNPYGTTSSRGPKKAAAKEDDEEDTPPADPPGPYEVPLGDAVLPLLLLAAGYIFFIARKRRAMKNS